MTGMQVMHSIATRQLPELSRLA